MACPIGANRETHKALRRKDIVEDVERNIELNTHHKEVLFGYLIRSSNVGKHVRLK